MHQILWLATCACKMDAEMVRVPDLSWRAKICLQLKSLGFEFGGLFLVSNSKVGVEKRTGYCCFLGKSGFSQFDLTFYEVR